MFQAAQTVPTVRLGPLEMGLAEAAAAGALARASVGLWPPPTLVAAVAQQQPPHNVRSYARPDRQVMPLLAGPAAAPAAALATARVAALATAPAAAEVPAGGAVPPTPGSGVVHIERRMAGAGESGARRGRAGRALWTETPSNIAALHSAPSSVTESPAQMLAAAVADPTVMWHQGGWVNGASGHSRQRLDFGQGPAQ